MATNTTNYNLIKPDGTEKIDVSVINDNIDIIDTTLYLKANSADVYTKSEINASLSNKADTTALNSINSSLQEQITALTARVVTLEGGTKANG